MVSPHLSCIDALLQFGELFFGLNLLLSLLVVDREYAYLLSYLPFPMGLVSCWVLHFGSFPCFILATFFRLRVFRV